MIRRYVAALSPQDSGLQIGASDGYVLYAALLEALGGKISDKLHSAEDLSISQHIVKLTGREESLWTVNLIGAETISALSPVIESMKMVELRSCGATLSLEIISRQDVGNLDNLLKTVGTDMDCGRFLLRFLSPCAFRSGDEYVIFPSAALILGSLRRRWNAAFSFAPVEDKYALSALTSGVKITGYHLRGASFRLKGISIPSFSGTATLSARLAPPLLRLFRAMLAFGAYCGIGIKTTLGMGGVEIKESPKPQSR